MPNKTEQFAQIADQTAVRLTASWQEWAAFLTTASRLYKYPYHEQLLIYAQRPDATACAEYDLWNEKMGRYVRRGSKGIALVDDSGDRPRLRYVFDVSDTGTRPNPPPLAVDHGAGACDPGCRHAGKAVRRGRPGSAPAAGQRCREAGG